MVQVLSPLAPSTKPLAHAYTSTLRVVRPILPPREPAKRQPAVDSNREIARICAAISVRQRVRRGDVLCRIGERFEALFWVSSGIFVSSSAPNGSRGRTMGFHAAGDIIGIEGIAGGVHPYDVRALEDALVRRAPFALLEPIANSEPYLLQALHRVMSRELVRSQTLARVMAMTSADARLAAFLLDLSQRYKVGAAAGGQIALPMGRAAIGSYLGLTMETISRGFASLARQRLIDVRRRRLRIVDARGLADLVAAHG